MNTVATVFHVLLGGFNLEHVIECHFIIGCSIYIMIGGYCFHTIIVVIIAILHNIHIIFTVT